MTQFFFDRQAAFGICLVLSVLFYIMLPLSRENIRLAEAKQAAPRQTVTVSRAWTEGRGTHWIAFNEPVATPRKLQVTSEEWQRVSLPGSQLTIVVMPDGTPENLGSVADPAFERIVMGIGAVIWLGTTWYIVFTAVGWWQARRRRRLQGAGGAGA